MLKTLVGQGVVVVLPRELGLDETAGCEGLHGLDDFEIWHFEVVVFWGIVILLGDHHALCKYTRCK